MKAEDRYDSLFQYYGEMKNQNWLRLKAQVRAESDFDPDIVNASSGATGLAQFMPSTWKEWDDGTPGIQPLEEHGINHKLLDPRDPEDAIYAQACYMAWLLKQRNGAWLEALAAYNWGPGNVSRLIAAKPAAGRAGLPPETQNYITRIEGYFDEYKRAA
jgi:membrane-bound lytic murein transglycosylase D